MKKIVNKDQTNPVAIRQKTSIVASIASKFNNPDVTSISKLPFDKSSIVTTKTPSNFLNPSNTSTYENVKSTVTKSDLSFKVSKTNYSQRGLDSRMKNLDIGSRCDNFSDFDVNSGRNETDEIHEIDSENEYDFQSVVKENRYDKNEADTVEDDWQDEKNFNSKLMRASKLYNPRLTVGDVYDIDDDLLDKPYYFDIPKEKATNLMSKTKKKGSYLVRPSEMGEYVLMVLYDKNYIKKFKIQQCEHLWSLGVSNQSKLKFSTASELIDHYTKEGICCGNINIKFVSPVPKPKK